MLHAAHAVAFVSEEIELSLVRQCVEVGFVERQAGTVQDDLAATETNVRFGNFRALVR